MSKFELMTDNELMQWYWLALEMRDGKYLKAIKAEMNRRCSEE